jgi:hypothetical protein
VIFDSHLTRRPVARGRQMTGRKPMIRNPKAADDGDPKSQIESQLSKAKAGEQRLTTSDPGLTRGPRPAGRSIRRKPNRSNRGRSDRREQAASAASSRRNGQRSASRFAASVERRPADGMRSESVCGESRGKDSETFEDESYLRRSNRRGEKLIRE